MQNLTFINLIWGILGIIFFALLRLKNPLLKKTTLNKRYWFKDNWIDLVLSTILFLVFIEYQQEVVNVFGLQIVDTENISKGLRSFILGTAAYPSVNYVSDIIKKRNTIKPS